MPRQRNPKLLLIKKQKALIDSRLLQIRLKVDDYVYKNIPISANNATLYLKEVSSYEDKCLNDKRSLQVIETLIHSMKGIIQEHKELQDQNDRVSFGRIEIPTSDLMDDDLTQLSQNIEEIESKLQGTNKNVEKTVQFHDKTRITKRAKFDDQKSHQNVNFSFARVEIPPTARDDLTQLSQEIEEIDSKLQEMKKNAEKTVQLHDKTQITKRAKFDDKDVINLCNSNDEIEKTNNINMNNCDENILHKAISELSIHKENSISVIYDCENCSQRILPDINSENNKKITSKNMVTNNQGFEQYIETTNISNEFNKAGRNKSKPAVQNISMRKLLNITSLANKAADILTTEFTPDNNFDNAIPHTETLKRKPRKYTRKNNKKYTEILEKKTKRKPRCKKANKNVEEKAELIVEKKTNQGEIHKNIQTKYLENEANSFKPIDMHPTKNITPITLETIQETAKYRNDNGFQNVGLSKHSHINSDINLSYKMNTFPENPIIQVDDKVDKNDLSWIENIRYVREINVEEIIPAYYDDSFWDNYLLPNDWNDCDFL